MALTAMNEKLKLLAAAAVFVIFFCFYGMNSFPSLSNPKPLFDLMSISIAIGFLYYHFKHPKKEIIQKKSMQSVATETDPIEENKVKKMIEMQEEAIKQQSQGILQINKPEKKKIFLDQSTQTDEIIEIKATIKELLPVETKKEKTETLIQQIPNEESVEPMQTIQLPPTPPPPPPPPPPPMLPNMSVIPPKYKNCPLKPVLLLQNSFFQDLSPVQLNEEELLHDFGLLSKPEPQSRRDSGIDMTETKMIRVLDERKCYTLDLMMKQLKKDHLSVKNAILQLDSEMISVQLCKTLLKFLPTEQEMILLQETSESCLRPPEIFLKHLSEVSDLQLRLESLLFLQTFEETASEIQSQLEPVLKACMEILEHQESFKLFLRYALSLAQLMNKGRSGLQETRAFRLSDLLKLREIKPNTTGQKQGKNLFAFLLKMIHQKNAGVLQFYQHWPNLKDASKIKDLHFKPSFQILKEGISSLEMLAVSEQIEEMKQVILYRVEKVKQMYKSISQLCKNVEQKFALVLTKCNEIESQNPECFFSTLLEIIDEIKKFSLDT